MRDNLGNKILQFDKGLECDRTPLVGIESAMDDAAIAQPEEVMMAVT